MKRIFLIFGIVLALLLVTAVALPFLIDPNDFRPMLESNLSGALGRQVKLGDLKLAILAGAISASDLSVADDPAYSRTPFVQAKSLNIGVELWPLIASRRWCLRRWSVVSVMPRRDRSRCCSAASTAPMRRAPGSIRGTLRIPCIWAAAPRRDGAAPAALAGSPTLGRPRGRGRTSCRSRSRSAPS